MADLKEAQKWNRPHQLPNPDDYNSFQKQIYSALRRPQFPVDFKSWEAAARKNVPAPKFAYVYGSATAGRTYAHNVSAFDRYRIRPKMLVDATVRDVSIELFGKKYNHPLILCPIGVQSLMHKDGEEATARAAQAVDIPYVHSSASTRSPEKIASISGGERWFQLYWPRPQSEEITVSILKRAQESGYRVLVVTLDTFNLAWRPADLNSCYLPFIWGEGNAIGMTDPVFNARYDEELAADPRSTTEKLKELWAAMLRPGTPYGALRVLRNVHTINKSLAWFGHVHTGTYRDWSDVPMLRKLWSGPIVLKGIQSVEDAQKAIDAGVDGIWVSNHGGRQVDGAMASLDALAEIGADDTVVRSGIKIIFDSGIRTGSDVLKAMALGAHAVGIGRPYMYGLAMGGQAGVEHIVRCMLADMDNALGNMGKKSVHDLSRGDLMVCGFEAKL